MNNIIKSSNLSKQNQLEKLISFEFYILWHIKDKRFFYGAIHRNLPSGIFLDKEEAEEYIHKGYVVLYIDLRKQIPLELINIANLDEEIFSRAEKEYMISMKFHQLVDMFIFRNKNFKEQLKEQYK